MQAIFYFGYKQCGRVPSCVQPQSAASNTAGPYGSFGDRIQIDRRAQRHLARNWFSRSRLLDFSPINLRLEPPHFNASGRLLSGSSRSSVHPTARGYLLCRACDLVLSEVPGFGELARHSVRLGISPGSSHRYLKVRSRNLHGMRLGDPSFSALFRRSLRSREIERTVDQTDMTERLREVSNHPLGVRIVLLR